MKFVERGLYDAKLPNIIPQKQDNRTIKIPIPKWALYDFIRFSSSLISIVLPDPQWRPGMPFPLLPSGLRKTGVYNFARFKAPGPRRANMQSIQWSLKKYGFILR